MTTNEMTDAQLRTELAHYEAINDSSAQVWIVSILDELRFRTKFPEYAIA